jgi:Spx/MgsR family transcriptional regulator
VASTSEVAGPVVIHGIPNCDTVKRARAWWAASGRAHRFHDLRRDGLTPAMLDAWVRELGWEPLLNRRGTTWRALGADRQALVVDEASAKALMLAEVSVIKRPVVVGDGRTSVGWVPEVWTTWGASSPG